MSRIEGTTSLQTKFLRAFKTHPDGPPPELWPSPAVFRNWLRPPAFRTRPQAIVAAVRCPTHPRRALAANRSAEHLATSAAHDSTQDKQDNHLLLRLHHLHYLRQPKPDAPAARGLADPQRPKKEKPKPYKSPDDYPSEREWIRAVNGEQAALAFDRLIALKQKIERDKALEQSTPQPTPDQPHAQPDQPFIERQ